VIELVILKPPVQCFEHRIGVGGHLRHAGKHLFRFLAVDHHPAFLLVALLVLLLSSCTLPPLGPLLMRRWWTDKDA
jgi:hypothetical protein